jgi:hypothetical protein
LSACRSIVQGLHALATVAGWADTLRSDLTAASVWAATALPTSREDVTRQSAAENLAIVFATIGALAGLSLALLAIGILFCTCARVRVRRAKPNRKLT